VSWICHKSKGSSTMFRSTAGRVFAWAMCALVGLPMAATATATAAVAAAPTQYGPGVRALGVYLHVFQHLPYDRACQALGVPWYGPTFDS